MTRLHTASARRAETAADLAVIRLLLAIPTRLLCGAFSALLDAEPDIEVVGLPTRLDGVIPAILATSPDVVVLEADTPECASTVLARRIAAAAPDCAVAILTRPQRPGDLRRALAARVRGFLSMDAPPEQLVDGIRRLASGDRAVTADLAVAAMQAAEIPLTSRELEILDIAAEGAAVEEIATRLCLSVGTVRNYLSGVRRKTGARNRVDAIRIARDAGWL